MFIPILTGPSLLSQPLRLKTELQTFRIVYVAHLPQLSPELLVRGDHANPAEIRPVQRIGKPILQAILILDTVLDDHVGDIVNGFRDALKLYLPHFDGLQQETVETPLEILPLSDVLRKDQLVHILLNRVHSLQIVLNVHKNLGDALIDPSQLVADVPYLLLRVLPLR